MKRSLSIVALMTFVAGFGVGCTAPSLNLQCSAIRGAGDFSGVLYLEKGGGNKLEFRAACVSILNAIETGQVKDLPLAQVETKLLAAVPAKYSAIVSGALASVQGQAVNVQAIGADNVRRLRAYVVGLISGADGFE